MLVGRGGSRLAQSACHIAWPEGPTGPSREHERVGPAIAMSCSPRPSAVLINRKPIPPFAARRWVSYVRDAFPEERVDLAGVDLVSDHASLTSHRGDQYVCALAIIGDAEQPITRDRGYPEMRYRGTAFRSRMRTRSRSPRSRRSRTTRAFTAGDATELPVSPPAPSSRRRAAVPSASGGTAPHGLRSPGRGRAECRQGNRPDEPAAGDRFGQ
jgi:hypothetical protein